LTWRGHRGDEPLVTRQVPVPREHLVVPPPPPPPAPARVTPPEAPSADDVTADLLAEPARTTESYDRVVRELMELAEAARARWNDADRAAFDARVAGLRSAIAQAGQPRSVRRAQGSLIRYLQSAIFPDDMLLASGGPQ
jgi:hypothetical protein